MTEHTYIETKVSLINQENKGYQFFVRDTNTFLWGTETFERERAISIFHMILKILRSELPIDTYNVVIRRCDTIYTLEGFRSTRGFFVPIVNEDGSVKEVESVEIWYQNIIYRPCDLTNTERYEMMKESFVKNYLQVFIGKPERT